MKNKSKWSESHPVAYALVTVVVAVVLAEAVVEIMAIIADGVASMVMYGSLDHIKTSDLGLVATAMQLLSSVIVLLLFWLIFRKNLRGFFNARRFGASFLLGWSVLAICVFSLVASILEQESYGNFGAALLMGLQPGIGEETVCRVIPICLVMRSRNRERLIVPVIVSTSIIFGLIHSANILAGANPVATVFQVVYAACLGFLFAVIYLKTGDIWISMLLHTAIDAVFFLGSEAQSGGGVLSQGVGVADVVLLLVCTVLFFANAFLLFRKTDKAEILNTWSGIWKTEAES